MLGTVTCEGLPMDESTLPDVEASQTAGGSPFRAEPALGTLPAIPGYLLLCELGRGGMGVVYQARQLRLNRLVALKMILAGDLADPEAGVRFLAEAEAVARIQHPNIVQIHQIADHQGRPYLEMEFVPGGSLAERLDGTPRPPGEAAHLLESLANGIHEAHTRGIVHRDLKPANILMGSDGTPKIADFGLAKWLGQDTGLTRTDSILGSPSYMAPEQAEGHARQAGPAADVYSLGAILYEQVTGRPPFKGATLLQTLEQVRTAEPVFPSRLVPGLPRDLETICLKALQKAPARRYGSALEMGEDLRRFLDGRPILARPVGAVERAVRWARRNPLVALSSGVAVLGLAVAAIVATVAYARTSSALRTVTTARNREADAHQEADRERRQAERRLYRSLVGEARALRIARVGGYRRQAFERLARARAIATPDRDLDALRQEAVACLGDFVGLDRISFDGFAKRVTAVALHPHSELLAIGLDNGEVQVRPAAGGDPRTVVSAPGSVVDLTFGQDGRSLLVGRRRGPVRRYEERPDHGWVETEWKRDIASSLCGFARLKNGRVFALSHTAIPNGIELRDLEDGTTTSFDAGDSSHELANVAALSPDRQFLVCRSEREPGRLNNEGGFWLWDTSDPRRAPRMLGMSFGPALHAAFSPDSRLLACGFDQGLAIYEVPSFQTRAAVRWDSLESVAFSPDGQYLAAGTITGLVKIWSVSTNREVATLRHEGDTTISHVAFSADGRLLMVQGPRRVHVWNFAGTAERRELAGHAAGVTAVVFSPDGAWLASSSWDRQVRIWDAATGELTHTLPDFRDSIQTIAFTPDRHLIATGGGFNGIRIWDTRDWTEQKAPETRDLGAVYRVVFSADGSLLIASGNGLAAWRRDASGDTSWRPYRKTPGSGSVYMAISPDSELAAFVQDKKTVSVYDLEKKRVTPLSQARLLLGWHNLAFRPHSRQLAFISDQGTCDVWDLSRVALAFRLGEAGTFESFHMAISPGGRWLVAEPTPPVAAVWDLRRRALAFTLREERGPIWSFAWSPDDRRLAVGLADGGLVVWDLNELRARLAEAGLEEPGDALPATARANLKLARVRLDEGQPGMALEPLRRAVQLDPRSAEAQQQLGRALYLEGDHAAAAAAYRSAVSLRPNAAEIQLGLAGALLALRDNDGAVAAAQSALRLGPPSAEAHSAIGLARARRSDFPGAIAAYRESVRIHPTAQGYYELGLSQWFDTTANRRAAAVDSLREAVRLDPKFLDGYFNLATMLRTLGRRPELVEVYRQAQANDPRGVQALEGSVQDAELHLRIDAILAGSARAEDPAELLELAHHSQSDRNYGQAVGLWEIAFAADPGRTAGERFEAACAAALTASGQGNSAPTDAARRSALRHKALDWLRADFDVIAKTLPGASTDVRERSEKLLQRVATDPRLASLRDEAEVAKLPEDERALWRTLWADVDRLTKAGPGRLP
jgi:WD40 repeat protein